MALFDTTWYCNYGNGTSTGYYAVTVRPQNTAVAAGVLRRQFTAPAVGSERVFVCIVAGTTANTTDATWVLTRGAKTTDGTATWQECTGASAVNGDLTNTPNWTTVKNQAVTLGQIIQRNNGASYQICSTAGTTGNGSEPSFSDTAGTTTVDNTVTWTSLGVVGNFSGGGAPHARLANVCATNWFAAGSTVFVGDNHAETQASSMSLGPAGSNSTVGKFLCHNHSSSYPPASGDLTTGASVSTSGSGNLSFSSSAGSFYFYGIAFISGVGSLGGTINLSATGSLLYFDVCSLQIAATSGTLAIAVGTGSATVVVFNNTTVKFAAVGQGLSAGNGAQFFWQNTGQVLVSGSSVPTNFLTMGGNADAIAVLEALDLSQLTGTIVTPGSPVAFGFVLVKDCRLNGSATVATPISTGLTVQLVRSDSGATFYKSTRYQYEGTETTETSITRVGGAVDPSGQQQSRKIVTTANVQWLRRFKAEPYAIWNSVTGANVTVTVYGTINSAVLPNNDEILMEVEYLGSSSFPIGTIIFTTKSNLFAASAPVASDGSTWNGGGSGAGWSPFKLVAVLSSPQPGMVGYIHARVKAAKPSTTYYIDPQIVLS